MGIVLCFLPLVLALLILTFGFKLKFTHELLAVFIGLITVLPISFIQYFLPSLPSFAFSPVLYALIKSLLLYGLIEELFKMGACFTLPYKNYLLLHFLLLSFVMGLALGCFESVVYYFDHLQIAKSKGAQLLYGSIAIRIFTSDLIHMLCTGLCGIFVFTYKNKQMKTKISFLLLAIFLHGIYDFFAGFSSDIKWFSVIVVLFAIAECRIKYCSIQNE